MPKPFDQARRQLERQYLDAKYDPASGLSKEELIEELERHRAGNPGEPRILTRAWLFRLLCSKARIAADPEDYFADKLEHHNLLTRLRGEWQSAELGREFKDDPPSVPGAFQFCLDLSHTSPDWRNLFKHGLSGLRERAASQPGVFHQSVAMAYEGALELARRLGAASLNPALAALSERPPQTFHEALQLACLYNELQEVEGEPVRSMGRFDLLCFPFYSEDLKAGRLSRDQAKELLKYFWMKFYAKSQGKSFGKPFLFGPDANDLSCLAFEAFREMRVVDPKFHVRLAERTPDSFLEKVIGCLQSGCTSVVMANDAKQIEMLRRNGRAPEDAEDYILIGCYEPAIMGKEMNCSCASLLNLAKAVEIALASGDFPSFEDLMAACFKTLDAQFSALAEKTRRAERLWPLVNPSPFLSGTMDSCVERGLDVSQAGAKYNMTGCVCVGLANAVDSLAAVRRLVYEERRCSLAELKSALAVNWKGYEALRMAAMSCAPKWGNDDGRVDELAVRIASFLGERINREPNARGGVFQAALYGIVGMAKDFGKLTGALPDGRLAGEPLTMNTGATPGMDKGGATSLINSVTKLDLSQFPSGTVLDIMLHPSAASGASGAGAILSLIRGHFARGGMAIQFNVFDAATLRDAQRRPERYAGLQVRICGWNARFVDLAPDEQAVFIAKAEAVS